MKVAAVVLSRNQEKFAPLIAKALAGQSVKPDRTLVVLDRPGYREERETRDAYAGLPNCDMLVIHTAPGNIARPPMRPGVLPFCAGRCRNLALELLDAEWYDLAVFIDGDCIPYGGWVESHRATVEAHGGGRMVTIGRRREDQWQGHDQRERCADHPIDIFGPESSVVTSEWQVADSGILWSCNFGITRDAVAGIKKLNGMLYGTEELFHSGFTGRWGGEDGFLGMECFYGGIPMVTVPALADEGVRHIEHLRPDTKYDHATFLKLLDSRRRELMTLMAARGMCGGKFQPRDELVREARHGKE